MSFAELDSFDGMPQKKTKVQRNEAKYIPIHTYNTTNNRYRNITLRSGHLSQNYQCQLVN